VLAELGPATPVMMLAHIAASQPHLKTLPAKALLVSTAMLRVLRVRLIVRVGLM